MKRTAASRAERTSPKRATCSAGRVVGRGGHPGDVGVGAQAAVGSLRLARPQVDQHQVAGLDRQRHAGLGRVVRVAGVRTDGHDGRVVELEAFVAQAAAPGVAGRRTRSTVTPMASRLCIAEKRASLRAIERLGGALVAGTSAASQAATTEASASADESDLHAERADQVERARVDAADVRDGVAGRVLHQHAARAAEQVAQVPRASRSRPP